MPPRLQRLASALLLSTVIACGPPEQDGTCASDTDCKGDRICQAGACVSPASNNSPSNTATNNTPANNQNNATPPATCTQTCQALLKCDPSGDLATCEANCEGSITQAQRDCAVAAPTCPDAEACFGAAPPMNNANNNAEDGELGDTCQVDELCKSGRCKIPQGAIEGQCAQNDLGEKCTMTTECVDRICLVRDQEDDFGYCSRECVDASDSPLPYSCSELNNGAYKACVRN